MRKLHAALMLMFVVLMSATPVFAQAEAGGGMVHADWVVISAGFAMAIASSLCGLAQGRAISAAFGGLARKPGAAPAIPFLLLFGLPLI